MADRAEEIVESVVARYPNLVVEISGPWLDLKFGTRDYICNWKDQRFGFSQIHPGSRGDTMAAAVEASLSAVEQYMTRLPD